MDSLLRGLPSVDELSRGIPSVSPALAVRAARAAVAEARARIAAGEAPVDDLATRVQAIAAVTHTHTYGRVINASGVILHTNLGRAPLAAAAKEAVAEAADGYSNLELDLRSGKRGSRQAHLEALLVELTGAEAALAVNNGAAAVLLAAAAIAGGRELIVARGQLIEIGGSFRIPAIVEQSGARLVEVGTTNRTRRNDYAHALGANTGGVLRVHPSNFRSLGFVEDVEVSDLATLGVPVIDDVGSGLLVDDLQVAADEPQVRRSVASGASLVCFSGDKLLGGPQAGLLVGRADAIARCRSHPLARALRIDKLSLAALEATLRLYLDPTAALSQIPVLRMLAATDDELHARAQTIHSGLTSQRVDAAIVDATAKVGGGALPLLELPGPACAVDPKPLTAAELARRLRTGSPPIVGRIRDGSLLLDPRTVADDEVAPLLDTVSAAFA